MHGRNPNFIKGGPRARDDKLASAHRALDNGLFIVRPVGRFYPETGMGVSSTLI